MNLTTNFTLEEMIFSQTAIRNNIDNNPSPEIIDNLKYVATKLETLRLLFKSPIVISSGYRCPKLNYLVGGVPGGAHQQGLAVDFIVKGFSVIDVCKQIAPKVYVMGIDQLIYEQAWIHLGFSKDKPRCQILTANFKQGKTIYTNGLPL